VLTEIKRKSWGWSGWVGVDQNMRGGWRERTGQGEDESERMRRRAIEGRGSTLWQWIQPVTQQSKNMFILCCYKGIL